jgi:hypothetical protein
MIKLKDLLKEAMSGPALFKKVVKALKTIKYPVTILLLMNDKVMILNGTYTSERADDAVDKLITKAGLDFESKDYKLDFAGDSTDYSRNKYRDIHKINGGHR